jgi:hypothetical protein
MARWQAHRPIHLNPVQKQIGVSKSQPVRCIKNRGQTPPGRLGECLLCLRRRRSIRSAKSIAIRESAFLPHSLVAPLEMIDRRSRWRLRPANGLDPSGIANGARGKGLLIVVQAFFGLSVKRAQRPVLRHITRSMDLRSVRDGNRRQTPR